MLYKKFLEYNKKWAEDIKTNDRDFFSRLSKGQNPQILMIGCSDSRVSLEKILGADLGDLFIHRNIANLAKTDDENFMAVLEYSIEVLRVKHIIVMGHYQCGGVKAAVDGNNLSFADKWIEPVKKIVAENLKLKDEADFYDKISELNSIQQIENIRNTNIYQKALKNGYAPELHSWVFDIYSGNIKTLA